MGPFYDVQWFAGRPYIVFMDEATGWQEKAFMLSQEQYEEIDNFMNDQREKEQRFLKSFLKEMGAKYV